LTEKEKWIPKEIEKTYVEDAQKYITIKQHG
jgi:hypothetical protein